MSVLSGLELNPELQGLEEALEAGAIPVEEQPAVHLQLSRAYLEAPNPQLLKARHHAEQALAGAEAVGIQLVYAQALLHVGTCYAELRRFSDAIRLLERLTELLPELPPTEATLEGEALYQLGMAHAQRGEHEKARNALTRAQTWYSARGQDALSEKCRRHLFYICLKRGDQADLPALLDEGERYVRAHPEDHTALWALRLEQAEYALARKDLMQAVRSVNAALEAAGSDPVQCYDCYILLLRCAQSQGHHKDALNFGLSARIMALDAHRYDLDFQATVVFIELFRSLGDEASALLKQLDNEYQQRGLDIYRYLPESLLRRNDGNGGAPQ